MKRRILTIILLLIISGLSENGLTNSYYSNTATIENITISTGGWEQPIPPETVIVPAVSEEGVNTVTSYIAGTNLLITARGIYNYNADGGVADAEYQMRPSWWPVAWGGPGWINGDVHEGWENELDLVINNQGYNWIGSFPGPDPTNEYTLNYTVLSDGVLNFKIFDNNYDNSGSLTVVVSVIP
jgi:hypothetical protein